MVYHLFNDKKKTVTITGSSGSLGYELAKKFNLNNYNLILHTRKKSSKILKFKGKNKSIELVYGDLEKKKTIADITKLISKSNFNIIINNSGIYKNKPFNKCDLKDLKEIFDSNFFSNIYLLHNVIKKKLNNVLIININSIAGINGTANESVYSASKHALKGFYDSIEKEPNQNINFLNIFPGAFKSKISKKRKDFQNLMEPEEVAEIIYKSTRNYESLAISNIFLKRKKY